ncbi:MAG TPA: DUF3995 domain-containing protein [Candidatus Paenibacillus intestinavium]|nr:DUF3995 domain-containing protein [Candidatus Paenibacillus intestinavium]
MSVVFVEIAAFLLFVISLLHVYWAFGGKRGLKAVLPEQENIRTIAPGIVATVLVAILVASAALLLLMEAGLMKAFLPSFIVRSGVWVCAVIFALRVIGEFNYFGIFKKKRNTTFAKMDKYLYMPLCAYLSLVFLASIQIGG